MGRNIRVAAFDTCLEEGVRRCLRWSVSDLGKKSLWETTGYVESVECYLSLMLYVGRCVMSLFYGLKWTSVSCYVAGPRKLLYEAWSLCFKRWLMDLPSVPWTSVKERVHWNSGIQHLATSQSLATLSNELRHRSRLPNSACRSSLEKTKLVCPLST